VIAKPDITRWCWRWPGVIQSTVPILGARLHDPALMNVARSTALAQLLFVAASFAALVTLHVTSDVFPWSTCSRIRISQKPLIYKDHRRWWQP